MNPVELAKHEIRRFLNEVRRSQAPWDSEEASAATFLFDNVRRRSIADPAFAVAAAAEIGDVRRGLRRGGRELAAVDSLAIVIGISRAPSTPPPEPADIVARALNRAPKKFAKALVNELRQGGLLAPPKAARRGGSRAKGGPAPKRRRGRKKPGKKGGRPPSPTKAAPRGGSRGATTKRNARAPNGPNAAPPAGVPSILSGAPTPSAGVSGATGGGQHSR
jgi:hypothetical protein